jgi:hypothetical protein
MNISKLSRDAENKVPARMGGVSTIEIVDDKKYDVAVANAVSFLEKLKVPTLNTPFLVPTP